MGLDQYAYAVMPHKDNTDLDFVWNRDNEPDNYKEFFYWRKNPNLHGWMESLYRSKGGEGQFNCSPLRLTFKDIQDLEDAVKGEKLPHTEGFFFGHSRLEDDQMNFEFIRQAREAIAMDMQVYYYSWW